MVNVRWGYSETESKYTPNGYPGCSPIAMAQIMSYFKYPSSIAITYPGASISSQYLDWNSMLEHEVEHRYKDCTATEEAHEAISQLVRQLGKLGSCVYGQNGTSNYITQAASAMKSLGYNVSVIKSDIVEEMLSQIKNGQLLYMRGTDPTYSSGHAWVADGFIEYKMRITRWTRRLSGSTNWAVDEVTESNIQYLHYNWGREGHCNGYFYAGIYSPINAYEYDNYVDDSYNEKFERDYNYDVAYFSVSR